MRITDKPIGARTLLAIAASLWVCGSAMAQAADAAGPMLASVPAAPLVQPAMLPPLAPVTSSQPTLTPSSAANLGAAASAVQFGSQRAGTLKEVELLQREAVIAELRAKLRGMEADAHGVAAPATPGVQGAAATSLPAVAAPAPTLEPVEQPLPKLAQPGAAVVNTIIAGGVARADVIENGVIRTINVGDQVGDWTVKSIALGRVMVEGVETERVQRKGSKGKPIKGSTLVEKTVTAMLKSHAVAAPVATAVELPTQGGVQPPVIPPLPQDSTMIQARSIR